MSGVGPLGGANWPDPLSRIDRDGSGAGGRYEGGRRQQEDEEQPSDQADISDEAKQKGAPKRQLPASARPAANDARLEILTDITAFNERHVRMGIKLKALLMPAPQGSILVIEDPAQGVKLKPFGDDDVFHHAPQEVRTRLETFDRSAGSLFDGRG